MKHKNAGNQMAQEKNKTKCFVITSDQVQSMVETGNKKIEHAVSLTGRAVFVGTTITAISLFNAGCTSAKTRASNAEYEHDPQKLASYAKDKSYLVRGVVASNKSTPGELLAQLANDEKQYVKELVVMNKRTPPEILHRLVASFDAEQLYAVAYKMASSDDYFESDIDRQLGRHIDSNALDRIAVKSKKALSESRSHDEEDRQYKILAFVAMNAKTPATTLRDLLNTEIAFWVRELVAKNPNTPRDTIELLLHDETYSVVNAAIVNPNIAQETLERLLSDPKHQFLAASNPSIPSSTLIQLASSNVEEIRMGVASNKGTPGNVLAALAQDNAKGVRIEIAGNEHTPPEALALLAQDNDKYVRANIAGNEHTPKETLAALAKDQEKYVRIKVAGNKNSPPDSLRLLHENYGSDVDDSYARYSVNEVLAANPSTPSDVLIALLALPNPSGTMLSSLMGNENAPEKVRATARTQYESRTEGVPIRYFPPATVQSSGKDGGDICKSCTQICTSCTLCTRSCTVTNINCTYATGFKY